MEGVGGVRSSTLAARRRGIGGVVEDGQRQELIKTRLDALENDGDPLELDQSEDEVFQIEDEVKDEKVEVGAAALGKKKQKKKSKKRAGMVATSGKRRTRGMESRAPKPFLQLLEEAQLETLPPDVPTYFTVAAKPSKYPPRKLCDISGFFAKYKDPSTKMRFAGLKEYNTIQTMPTAALHAHLKN
mmetsp:Transcript_5785/g.14871  ORF Transcript_5785/g.14871 Transcript_5785/m.14871 type:complete len:186 (+) Transcript_5785:73-630(+)